MAMCSPKFDLMDKCPNPVHDATCMPMMPSYSSSAMHWDSDNVTVVQQDFHLEFIKKFTMIN